MTFLRKIRRFHRMTRSTVKRAAVFARSRRLWRGCPHGHTHRPPGRPPRGLCRALSAEGDPSFATALKVSKALGLSWRPWPEPLARSLSRGIGSACDAPEPRPALGRTANLIRIKQSPKWRSGPEAACDESPAGGGRLSGRDLTDRLR